jgi:DNA segregation ATPase FtsK/SpoIIIE, S-DNA-T family
VSEGTNLSASSSLEVLRRLQDTAAHYAAQEEGVIKDLRTRRFHTERGVRQSAEQIGERLAEQIADIEAGAKEAEEKVRAIHEGRVKWLQRAGITSVNTLPKRVEFLRERWLGQLQMRKLRAERKFQTDMAATGGLSANENAALAKQKAKMDELEAIAKRLLGSFGSLKRLLRLRPAHEVEVTPENSSALIGEVEHHLKTADQRIAEFRDLSLPKLFRILPLGMMLFISLPAGTAVMLGMGSDPRAFMIGGAVAAGAFLLALIIYAVAVAAARPVASEMAKSLVTARQIEDAVTKFVAGSQTDGKDQLQAAHDREMAAIQSQWDRVDEVQAEFERKAREKLKVQGPRAKRKNDEMLQNRLDQIAAERALLIKKAEADAEANKRRLNEPREVEMGRLMSEENAKWTEMESGWQSTTNAAYEDLAALNAARPANFPAWSKSYLDAWSPPREFVNATRFGQLDLNLSAHPETLPKDERLALPGAAQVSVPLMLSLPQQGSVLFETNESCGGEVMGAINNIMLRLLATTPPGKIAFTILDPVGLGQNFAGVMHLGDYEEAVINRRIWTQRDQIEERLSEINEHIEKVIQMYLRNEYETITEYNEKAGTIAEKYYFLVVADFPAGFSDVAAKRLQSIALSGPRCGVFTLIHWDKRHTLPDGFVPDELRQTSVVITREKGVFTVAGAPAGARLVLDPPPPDDLAVALVHKIGKASIDSNRVEVPFKQIAPKEGEMWTSDTTNELRVPIGRTGATKLQYLAIGKGTKQHALFAGKTGSGKSTLFHVIITNLSLHCSPDQVEFYLIDFKKGVEFKCYAENRLPHAKVVAIESDREFGLSVLQRVDEELRRRGDMFRKLGAQDIAGYKKAGGTEPMPRCLLMIDEFQEFFTEDDPISQTASVLFDRIVRQGRAFGIHVLLGSQTLGGAFTLARATMGQMVIRVALMCNEADAYLIMDENNPAPRLLSRPGEGIYNDSAGAIEGNSPFQVVWLGDDERDVLLEKVRAMADERHDKHAAPIVFEGNAPAEIRENGALAAALESKPTKAPVAPRIWLGAPNSIKGPSEAVFHRQSGNHLLIVGQREEAALTMMGMALISLAAQCPPGSAKFYFIHASAPESADEVFLQKIFATVPQGLVTARAHELGDVMTEIANELKERTGGDASSAPPVFVFIHGLHKFKKLRAEDDFDFSMSDADAGPKPSAQFLELINEGSSHGMHIITTVDTFNNVGRFISRKALSEFEMRVVFQMSQNDSASLIDSPKASTLGLHRALLYNEHEGSLETFRPYAMPDDAWIEGVKGSLKR